MEPQKKNKFLFGSFNAVAYKGSLQETYKRWTPAFQAGLVIEVKKKLKVQFSGTYGHIIGEDRNYRLPANANPDLVPLSRFRTDFFSFGVDFQYLAFEHKGFQLLGSLGFGIFRFSPKDFNGNDLSTKSRTRATGETYNQNAFQMPIHLIAQYWFKPQLGFGFQAGWLNVNNPYLDNMDQLSTNSRRDNVAVVRFQVLTKI